LLDPKSETPPPIGQVRLVQRRRDKRAAKRLIRKLPKKQMRPPRVIITHKLASHAGKKGGEPALNITSTRD
jgi:hypothetical protein